MATATITSPVRPVLTALRKLGGRATVGDVAAATGLPHDQAEQSLRELLEGRRGHLEVGEAGTLVYNFDPRLIGRDAEPFWERFKRRAWDVFKKGFKVWIVVTLVVYVAIFVALLVAALLAGNRDGEGGGWGGGEGGRRHRGGGLPMGDMLFWYWIWSPGWRRRPYYGELYGRRDPRDKKSGPPFYKKVFAFVFGPDQPTRTPEQKDRELLRFVRARKGVMTAPELVQLSGMGLHEAEEELGRLMASHEGDVKVADDGTILYLFPSLMVSAGGKVVEREPLPAWKRLEPRQPFTGNKAASNAMVVGLNAFNLIAAATAPLFIFPRLGIGDYTAAWVGFVWFPVAFSALFFAVPAMRWLGVARENSQRAIRNVRKVLVGLLTKASLEGEEAAPLTAEEAAAKVRQLLPDEAHARVDVTGALDRLVAEFDGDVQPGPDGSLLMRFPHFRGAVASAHAARTELALQDRRVGDIVYSSADDASESSRRDMGAFDRELGEGALGDGGSGTDEKARTLPLADLSSYLNDPLKVAFRDERELAAMQMDMQAQAEARSRR